MRRIVAIDCFPDSVQSYAPSYAVVGVDVIRATTSAVTAVATGRRCIPVPSVQAARRLAERLPGCLLAGEEAGDMPAGFDLNNSPAELAELGDLQRPVILLSSSGTRLLHKASRYCDSVYIACLRNAASTADFLAAHHERVVIIGAGSRMEFREEDQLCCAWIAKALLEAGFEPMNSRTHDVIREWRDAKPNSILDGKSAAYLRRSGQWKDMEFILNHINDLQESYSLRGDEVVVSKVAASHPILHSPSEYGYTNAEH